MRDSEVHDFSVKIGRHENVSGLDVAVYDAVCVSVAERFENVPGDAQSLIDGESLLVENLPQRRALQVLHDYEGRAVIGVPNVVDRGNGVMLELAGGARLSVETLAVFLLLGGHEIGCRLNELDCDWAIDGRIASQQYRPHGAPADDFLNFETSQLFRDRASRKQRLNRGGTRGASACIGQVVYRCRRFDLPCDFQNSGGNEGLESSQRFLRALGGMLEKLLHAGRLSDSRAHQIEKSGFFGRKRRFLERGRGAA